MASIAQQRLFGWKEVEGLGDLERLRLVLEHLPDEPLMRLLERERDRGRNDYPVRAMWNSLLAAVVYQHASVESLRRELGRNGQLRWMCGFRGDQVPTPAAYSRFLKSLMHRQSAVQEVFDRLVECLQKELPDFGRVLAIDGKGVKSYGRPRKKGASKRVDGRRDLDADVGVKTRQVRQKDGAILKKVKTWFGYKLHLVVEAEYELPVAFEVTRAAAAELPQATKMLDHLSERHPAVLDTCRYGVADRGYDATSFITRLWDDHRVKPLIDIRDVWKDEDETRQVEGTENVVYDWQGQVWCYCLSTGQLRRMAYGGFEEKRGTLKYRCPAHHYGLECSSFGQCPVKGAVRVKLSQDRRVFTPLARATYGFRKIYRKRSAVERVNSRVDAPFGLERHFVRGLSKMKLRCGLALIAMLGMALGRVKEKQRDRLRSLLRAA